MGNGGGVLTMGITGGTNPLLKQMGVFAFSLVIAIKSDRGHMIKLSHDEIISVDRSRLADLVSLARMFHQLDLYLS